MTERQPRCMKTPERALILLLRTRYAPLSTGSPITAAGWLRAVLLYLILLSLPVLVWADAGSGRFFLMGDGRIHIKNMHTGQEAAAILVNPDGSFNEAGFAKIDEVFEFPTKEKGEHISPRLLFMLDYFSDLVAPGKLIKMESGYRSPEYNTTLRNGGGNVAKTSIHMDGMALDFSIDGVNGKKLWEIIKSKDCCGVGHYGGTSVHLDAAKPRFWEAATSKVRTGESDYNQRIYLSTDYDRYRAGDPVRLSFASASTFGFGVKRSVALVADGDDNKTLATAQIKSPDGADCRAIPDRKTSHLLTFDLPPNLREGRYRIEVEFCQRPFKQMPLKTLSNLIELVGQAP
jgi:uncharacterized protein YcbK (DUF882 family)